MTWFRFYLELYVSRDKVRNHRFNGCRGFRFKRAVSATRNAPTYYAMCTSAVLPYIALPFIFHLCKCSTHLHVQYMRFNTKRIRTQLSEYVAVIDFDTFNRQPVR